MRSIEICHGIRWDRFRDGWPNIFINNVEEIAGKDGKYSLQEKVFESATFIVIFVASFHSPEVIFEQLSLIYAFPR